MNAIAPTAILSVIQMLSGLIWSMRREQTFNVCDDFRDVRFMEATIQRKILLFQWSCAF